MRGRDGKVRLSSSLHTKEGEAVGVTRVQQERKGPKVTSAALRAGD